MGENMFRLKDRKGAELCLAMTHEEVMTSIARNELRSYKQLPQIWYQIQTKFRDEPRPKSGLLRVRQFLMKDAYCFDIDAAGLDHSYDLHDAAYRAIFTRCGLEFVAVEADSGAMGGSQLAGVHGLHRGRRRPHRQLSASATPRISKRPPASSRRSKTSHPQATACPSSSTRPARVPSPTSARSSASSPRRTSSASPSWARAAAHPDRRAAARPSSPSCAATTRSTRPS